jgi:fatty acid desaturase
MEPLPSTAAAIMPASATCPVVARDLRDTPPGQEHLPKGFEPSEATRVVIRSFQMQIVPHRFVAAALFDHAVITACLFSGWWLWAFMPATMAIPASLVLWVLIGTRQRALHVLVHEGAHYNACRLKRLNDVLSNLFAGAPSFMRVAKYRAPHRLHHSGTGGGRDPDLKVHGELELNRINRNGIFAFARSFQLSRYFFFPPTHSGGPDWWAIGYGFSWHTGFVWAPLAVLFGVGPAAALWFAFWLGPMVFVLPLIRFVAEAAEHEYDGAANVVDATVSNLGAIHSIFINPHNDGYHLVHHLYPCVPFYHLAVVHDLLLALEPVQYGARCAIRARVLQSPSFPVPKPE